MIKIESISKWIYIIIAISKFFWYANFETGFIIFKSGGNFRNFLKIWVFRIWLWNGETVENWIAFWFTVIIMRKISKEILVIAPIAYNGTLTPPGGVSDVVIGSRVQKGSGTVPIMRFYYNFRPQLGSDFRTAQGCQPHDGPRGVSTSPNLLCQCMLCVAKSKDFKGIGSHGDSGVNLAAEENFTIVAQISAKN